MFDGLAPENVPTRGPKPVSDELNWHISEQLISVLGPAKQDELRFLIVRSDNITDDAMRHFDERLKLLNFTNVVIIGVDENTTFELMTEQQTEQTLKLISDRVSDESLNKLGLRRTI